MITTCEPQSKRQYPHPHGRKKSPMVTKKPKRIAPPTTIPGSGGKKTIEIGRAHVSDLVRAPIKAAISPPPRAKEIPDGHEEAKADCAADHDPGLRRKENNRRVIVQHWDEGRMDGHNRDVRTIANDDLGVGAQISVIQIGRAHV